MVSGGVWTRGRVLVVAAVFVGHIGVGCASREDQLFKTNVGQVLASCVDLKARFATVGIDGASPEALQTAFARQREELYRFRQFVNALPQPRSPRLRYLAIQIGALTERVSQYGRMNVIATDADMQLRDPEHKRPIAEAMRALDYAHKKLADASKQYDLALVKLAAAEHVILGTLAVRDGLEAKFVGGRDGRGSTMQSRDSLMTALELDVQSELAEFR